MDKKRILVVDDEPDFLEMFKTRLEANDYEVITASDGLEGLEKARKKKPDLIILDLMLPGIDGYQVCRLLKYDDRYRDIPIIMLTAMAQQEDKKWGEKVGANYYITKPFEIKELLAKIQELLEKKNG